jgi:alcohol dehydrogenase, propanol-preferring
MTAIETMRAAVVHDFRQPLTIDRLPIPTPGAGQVLIKMEASGVCHTDLHAADGDWPVRPTPPFVPGHEGVGKVVELGAGVSRLAIGDRVGIAWLASACGSCEFCLSGWETLCERQQDSGYSINGSFEEYAVANAAYVAKIPAGLDPAAVAPILCAGVTTYKGLKVTDTRPGQWVVISGVGGLGHMAVQYAKAMGLHVAAVDTADEKLELARKVGAELTVNVTTTDPVEVIQREIGGAHGVLVTAVNPAAFAQGVGMLRRGGTMSLVGLPPGDFPLPIFEVVLKALTIRGSIVGTRMDLEEALHFAAEGKVRATYTTEPLENINSIFTRLRDARIEGRIVLDFAA